MSTPTEQTRAVSDPENEKYDPQSPYYDVTADHSSQFYIGPIADEQARSGDDIRAAITEEVQNDPLAGDLSDKQLDSEIQRRYTDAVRNAREGLNEGLELRQAGEAPRTVWDNASHEQMVEFLNSKADSVAIAETSEEWVSLGNELTVHQRAVGDSVHDSMANWSGESGGAAREHLAEIAKWLGNTAQGAVLTGRQQQIHSQTLNESQKLMAANPPVSFSAQQANAELQQVTDPVAYAAAAGQVAQKTQQQQAAREQAARIMTQFDDTVGSAIDMPLFSAPPTLAQTAANTAAGGGAGAGGSANGAADRYKTNAGVDPSQAQGPVTSGAGRGGMVTNFESGAGAGAGGGAAGGQHAGNQPQVPGVPAASGSGSAGQNQPLSSYGGRQGAGGGAPGNVNVPGVNVPGGGGNAPQFRSPSPGFNDGTHASGNIPPTPTPPQVRVPDMPPTPSTGGPTTNNPNVSGIGTSASSFKPPDYNSAEYKSRYGSGKNPALGWGGGVNGDSISSRLGGLGGGTGAGGGPVPSTGFGGGVGGVGSGGASGAGGATGATPGAGKGIGADGMQGRGGPNAPGQGTTRGMTSGGMAPGMGAAGGKQGGDDDKEHRVAGYLDADEDLFATEEVIAPPVIGDWKNNKDGNWK